MGKSALPSIILLVLLCHVGAASGQNVQMTVSAVVPADSSSALTIRKMRSQAIGVAQRAVWQNLKAREEFRKLVYNFQQQQDEAMTCEAYPGWLSGTEVERMMTVVI